MKRERLKEPPLNTSPEAVALRKAAQAFATHDCYWERCNSEDRKGQQVNRALLKAALRYADAVIRKGSSCKAALEEALLRVEHHSACPQSYHGGDDEE